MICSNCGADIGDNETACPYCGAMQYENSEQKYMKDLYNLNEGMEKLDKNMEANATNSVKLREIMEQKEKAQADLDEKMDRWVYLNDLAERIEAQKSEK